MRLFTITRLATHSQGHGGIHVIDIQFSCYLLLQLHFRWSANEVHNALIVYIASICMHVQSYINAVSREGSGTQTVCTVYHSKKALCSLAPNVLVVHAL